MGVLFRGNAEAVIRQQLVRSGYVKAIIGLPANLFYGTGGSDKAANVMPNYQQPYGCGFSVKSNSNFAILMHRFPITTPVSRPTGLLQVWARKPPSRQVPPTPT